MGAKVMWGLVIGVACLALLVLSVLGIALALVASAPPKIEMPRDVFGLATRGGGTADSERPALERYPARDGAQLAYRFYDSTSERLLVFVHGSSYHGGGYHAFAAAISSRFCAGAGSAVPSPWAAIPAAAASPFVSPAAATAISLRATCC
jgi:non-heme chloroperoxidase